MGEIIDYAEQIETALKNNFDVLIKKTKDNTLKIQYYKPKNLKKNKQI